MARWMVDEDSFFFHTRLRKEEAQKKTLWIERPWTFHLNGLSLFYGTFDWILLSAVVQLVVVCVTTSNFGLCQFCGHSEFQSCFLLFVASLSRTNKYVLTNIFSLSQLVSRVCNTCVCVIDERKNELTIPPVLAAVINLSTIGRTRTLSRRKTIQRTNQRRFFFRLCQRFNKSHSFIENIK